MTVHPFLPLSLSSSVLFGQEVQYQREGFLQCDCALIQHFQCNCLFHFSCGLSVTLAKVEIRKKVTWEHSGNIPENNFQPDKDKAPAVDMQPTLCQ